MDNKYVNLETNQIFIYGDIEEEMVLEIAREHPNIDRAKTVVKVNSCGGDFYDVMSLITLLAGFKMDIVGVAHSAAAMFCLFGDVRMSKYGNIMFHLPMWETNMQNSKEHQSEAKSMDKYFYTIIKEGLKGKKLSLNKFKGKINNKEWHICPEEALKLGFIKEIY